MERLRYIDSAGVNKLPAELSRRQFLRLAGAATAAVPLSILYPGTVISAAGEQMDNKNLPPVLTPELPPLPEFKEPETNQKVIAIPLAAPGDVRPFTPQELDQTLGAVNSFFDRVSYGKMQFTFTSLPWQTLNTPIDMNQQYAVATTGDKIVEGTAPNDQYITRLGDAADKVVQNIDQYNTRMYLVTRGPANIEDKDVVGLEASQGVIYKNQPDTPAYNRVWLFGSNIATESPEYIPYSPLAVNIEHELGHTLGLVHEGVYIIYQLTNSSGRSYHPGQTDQGVINFDITQRVALGWVKADQLINVTESGIYDIAAVDTRDQTKKLALRMQNPYTGFRYYFSYDPDAPGNDVTGGLHGYHWNERKETGANRLVDTHTDKKVSRFTDPLAGINVTLLGSDGHHAKLEVTLPTK